MNIIYLLSIIYEMSSLNVLSVLIRENILCFDLKYYYFLRRKGNWFNELQKLFVQVLSSQEKKDEKNLLGTSYSDKEFLKKVFNVLIHIHSTVQVYCRCNIYMCTVQVYCKCNITMCNVQMYCRCNVYMCTLQVYCRYNIYMCTVQVYCK